jgi:hypothetical protein
VYDFLTVLPRAATATVARKQQVTSNENANIDSLSTAMNYLRPINELSTTVLPL